MFPALNRTSTPTMRDASRTTITHDTQNRPETSDGSQDPPVTNGTIRLRGGLGRSPRVAWDEHVIDNEDSGRKKSKICCIYHKPKAFDESSDEESSSDSDAEDDGRVGPRHPPHQHHHGPRASHDDRSESSSDGGPRHVRDGLRTVHEVEDPDEPNAYEIQPQKKKGKGHVDG